MKILLTGATGYVGQKLLPVLLKNGYEVICCVRNKRKFNPPDYLKQNISVLELDFLDESSLEVIPEEIDGAYYLIHSMSSTSEYEKLEQKSAINFKNALNKTRVQHVIYLSGIVNDANLSKHLTSRKNVEKELSKGYYNFTSLRAGIILGSGSASFEIIRDLVEKLPIMISPKWINTLCQPIAITDVLNFLAESLFKPETYNQTFDIGGSDILTYREMLLGYAKFRNLKRMIITVPVMTPRLSSYWLYFVTSTSFRLARNLVDSMSVEVVCKDERLKEILKISTVGYQEALEKILVPIESDSYDTSSIAKDENTGNQSILSDDVRVPEYGCLKYSLKRKFKNRSECIEKIWHIGGKNGWYFGNWLWGLRGFIDELIGGIGLRKGRTNPDEINVGDKIDFWKVLYANKNKGHLILYAEMKLPGEAWLEFKISNDFLIQTAKFRPRGVQGRLYWYLVYPFHLFLFNGLIKKLTKHS